MTIFTVKSPQKYVDVNREQCERLGVNPSDVFSTLQIYLGSLYANDFNLFGRTWQVNVQAMGQFRNQVEDVQRLMVRNKTRRHGPAGHGGDVTDINGPLILTRYNMYPAAAINGDTDARRQLRRRHQDHGGRWPTRTAQDDGLRVDGDHLHPAAVRQHGDGAVRPGRAGRVPGAGRPVRELGAAAGRHPGRADVPAQLDRRRLAVAPFWARPATSTSSRRSASWCWSAWRARTPS